MKNAVWQDVLSGTVTECEQKVGKERNNWLPHQKPFPVFSLPKNCTACSYLHLSNLWAFPNLSILSQAYWRFSLAHSDVCLRPLSLLWHISAPIPGDGFEPSLSRHSYMKSKFHTLKAQWKVSSPSCILWARVKLSQKDVAALQPYCGWCKMNTFSSASWSSTLKNWIYLVFMQTKLMSLQVKVFMCQAF